MDLEFRELLRHWRTHPTWSVAYRLLRMNEKITGELISDHTLRHFARRHLIIPFTQTIERLHEYEYRNAPVDEWDLWGPGGDQVQFNVLLQDDERAVQEGFIPSITDHPFKLMVVLILKNDIQYGNQGIGGFYPGFYGGARPYSIAFGRRVSSGLQSVLNSNTQDDLRRYIRQNFRNYDTEYIWGQPWGFRDVLPIPKDRWNEETRTNEGDLMLIYTFFPDDVLWNLLMGMEFKGR